jgi:RNA polymerase-binding transcription factor DksA
MNPEKAELLTKKEELEERLEKIRKDIAGGLSADFEEQATELENRDVLLEIARVAEEELESINKKLQQLND